MFGAFSFGELPFASIIKETGILYAGKGNYSYAGSSITLLNSKYLYVENGVYNYNGINTSIINTRIINANNGVYTYNGFTSTNKLFLGDWEFEFVALDVWTQENSESATWVTETTTPITWK